MRAIIRTDSTWSVFSGDFGTPEAVFDNFIDAQVWAKAWDMLAAPNSKTAKTNLAKTLLLLKNLQDKKVVFLNDSQKKYGTHP